MTNNTLKIQKLIPLAVGLFVGGTVWAQPGSGIRAGDQTVLIPSFNLSFNHNDNVNLRRRAISEGGEDLGRNDSDSFLNTQFALAMTHWGDFAQYNARAWFGQRRYDENTRLDRDTYGVSSGIFWTSSNADTTARIDLSLQRAVDRTENEQNIVGDPVEIEELENVSERVERDELRANLVLTQALTPRIRGNAGYNIADISYNEDRFNDRTSHLFSGELSYRLSEKTSPFVRVQLGLDDDEGLDGYARKPSYLIGVRYRPTDKLNLSASVGYESYTRTPLVLSPNIDEQKVERLPGDELKNSGLKFLASIQYAATPKTRVSLNGRSGYNSVASPGSSSREEISFSAALNHQTTRQINQRLSVAWREDDYLTPLPARGEEFDELKETIWYQYRIDYQTVRPWLSLFGNLSYEDGSSQIPGDSYTETQITLGLTARY